MRPGGHGVIWKLMWDEGVFEWLKKRNRRAAIVRQVSNPMASTDATLFGLSGMGLSQNKAMGFASCERVVGASEGMNVVQHQRLAENGTLTSRASGPHPTDLSVASGTGVVHAYGITNIEYTEFERVGLTDVAVHHNSSTSCFPANTNILYVALDTAKKAIEESIQVDGFGACLPGLFLNMRFLTVDIEQMCMAGLIFNTKKRVSYRDEMTGETKECLAGRMECMMQNLADSLVDRVHSKIDSESMTADSLSTFMVSNTRRKVTSSAKKKYKPGGSIRQTPEGSFWDLLHNAQDILHQCGMHVPEVSQYMPFMITLRESIVFAAWYC